MLCSRALLSSRLLRSCKTNTEPSKSSALNPIGTEKRHSVRVSCAGQRAGGGRRKGHDRCGPVRTAAGWPVKASHDFGLRVSYPFSIRNTASTTALHWTPWSEAAEAGLSILEAPKGAVDCLDQFRCALLSSQERPSLQAPLRSHHSTLRHRRLTRTRRDRSRYPGPMAAGSTTRRLRRNAWEFAGRLVPLTTISTCRLPPREQTVRVPTRNE